MIDQVEIEEYVGKNIDYESRGCLDLWIAVLDMASRDMVALMVNLDRDPSLKDSLYHRAKMRELNQWFLSKRSDVGSFHFICSIAGIDPDSVLATLRSKWADAIEKNRISRRRAEIEQPLFRKKLVELCKERGISMGAWCDGNGFRRNATSMVNRRWKPDVQAAIARDVGMPATQLWPERYDEDGMPRDQPGFLKRNGQVMVVATTLETMNGRVAALDSGS
ncbi:MAG: helix-turn-helix domain-containing protein [Magnetococcales bacterium]|nr:helix-turn-helix domain-containing protein [Magnetococcales bacterium]